MIKEITCQQLEKLLAQGAELVDVREEEELQEGAIAGGKNWPLSSFGLRQRDISQKRPTIFYCRSGMRSMKAAEIAADWTEQELYSLHGGFLHYQQEKGGQPESRETAPTPASSAATSH